MLKNDVEEKNIYSPFEILLELHRKIFESLKITGDDIYRKTKQNNLLIIFNSLIHCIIEYLNLENPDYKPIIIFFLQKRSQFIKSYLFQTLNFEIDINLLKKTKNIFIINNILSMFIVYIKYGTKEKYSNYFFENTNNCFSFNLIVYSIHVFIYTLQMINYLDKEIFNNSNSVEKIIDLYKKKKFKDFQLFNIAQKFYEILFMLKNYYGYNVLKAIIPNDDNENLINTNKITGYYLSSEIKSRVLNDIIINDNYNDISLDYSKKLSLLEYSKSMNIIFSFWRQIFNDIEIFMEDKKKYIVYNNTRKFIFNRL